MKHSLKTGFSFGLTSGVITTLGLMVGLEAGTHSKVAVMGGILTIAVADAFSDAFGIHMSQESQDRYSEKTIWESTIATFLAKFLMAVTFVVPVLLFELGTAIGVSVVWGLMVLSWFSLGLAKEQKMKPGKMVLEHVGIALAVILLTHYLGGWIAEWSKKIG